MAAAVIAEPLMLSVCDMLGLANISLSRYCASCSADAVKAIFGKRFKVNVYRLCNQPTAVETMAGKVVFVLSLSRCYLPAASFSVAC